MKNGKIKQSSGSFSVQNRLNNELATGSDFGIPETLAHALELKIELHGTLRLYLNFLLYRLGSGKFRKRLPIFFGDKTLYQEAGQNLEYFRFRPYSRDWMELMILARARGGSATLLFVTLLELDMSYPIDQDFNLTEGVFFPYKLVKLYQSLDLKSGQWHRAWKIGRSSDNPHPIRP